MIKDDKFDSVILDTIKENKIKPKAKWTFLLKDYVVWVLGLSSLIFGSIAVSIIIYLLKNNDWDLYADLSGGLVEFILLTMPYFWIVFLGIFIFVVNYNIKHTKNGYKFSLALVLLISVLMSVFFGILFFKAGLGRALDDVLGEKVSFYDTIVNPRIRIWYNPEAGRLMGVVVEKVSEDEFKLQDMRNREWLINVINAEIPIELKIDRGVPLKLLGEIENENENYFMVKRVFIHNGPGRGMLKHHCENLTGIRRYERMLRIQN